MPTFRVKKPAFRIGSGSQGVFSSDSAWYLQLANYGVDIWDVAIGKKCNRIRSLVNPWHFVLSRDKSLLAMSTGAGEVALVGIAGETLWRVQTRYFQTAPQLAFWGNDRMLVVGTNDDVISYDVDTGRAMCERKLDKDARVESISTSADQTLLAISSSLPYNQRLSRGRSRVEIFRDNKLSHAVDETEVEAAFARCALAPTGARVAVAGTYGTNELQRVVVLSHNLKNLAETALKTSRTSCQTLAWAADERELLLCCPSRHLMVLGSESLDVQLDAVGEGWWSLSASPDGQWIGVSGNEDGLVMPCADLSAYVTVEGPRRIEKADAKRAAFIRPAVN